MILRWPWKVELITHIISWSWQVSTLEYRKFFFLLCVHLFSTPLPTPVSIKYFFQYFWNIWSSVQQLLKRIPRESHITLQRPWLVMSSLPAAERSCLQCVTPVTLLYTNLSFKLPSLTIYFSIIFWYFFLKVSWRGLVGFQIRNVKTNSFIGQVR